MRIRVVVEGFGGPEKIFKFQNGWLQCEVQEWLKEEVFLKNFLYYNDHLKAENGVRMDKTFITQLYCQIMSN